jgi:hypothetical protein
MQADGLQQLLERLTHISIVIDNEYGWHILRAHNPRLNQKESPVQMSPSFVLSSPIKRQLTTPHRLYRMAQCGSRAKPRRWSGTRGMVAGIEEMVADKGYHSGTVVERVNLRPCSSSSVSAVDSWTEYLCLRDISLPCGG